MSGTNTSTVIFSGVDQYISGTSTFTNSCSGTKFIFSPESAGSSDILDALSAIPPLALSAARRLTNDYTGNLITVRRSSDNMTQAIGFNSSNVLDTAGLLSFVGTASGDNGFVSVLHNQGTLGAYGDGTQTNAANQPQIVSNGTVITDGSGGLPTMTFNAGTAPSMLQNSGTFALWTAGNMTLNVVMDWSNASYNYASVFGPPETSHGFELGVMNASGGQLGLFQWDVEGESFSTNFGSGTMGVNSVELTGGIGTATTTGKNYYNGTAGNTITVLSGTQGTGYLIGCDSGAPESGLAANISEVMLLQEVNATDRGLIETNQQASYLTLGTSTGGGTSTATVTATYTDTVTSTSTVTATETLTSTSTTTTTSTFTSTYTTGTGGTSTVTSTVTAGQYGTGTPWPGAVGGTLGVTGGTAGTLAGFSQTFYEGFTSPIDVGTGGTGHEWICHTYWNGDFGNDVFANPISGFPFVYGTGGLTILGTQDGSGLWHTGLLSSEPGGFQQAGPSYWEAKMKMPTNSGTGGDSGIWPAFWLVSTNTAPPTVELDVIEYYGNNNGPSPLQMGYMITEHLWENGVSEGPDQWTYWTMNGTSTVLMSEGELVNSFHTYGVLLDEQHNSYFFDGTCVYQTPHVDQYLDQPLFIMLDLAIGGGWPYAQLSGTLALEVEYVRVFKRN